LGTGDWKLSATGEQQLDIDPNPSELTSAHLAEGLAEIWQSRRLLVMITGMGLLLSIGTAWLIPNEYSSTAQLMPPDQQTFTGTSVLTSLNGLGLAAPSLTSSLMNQRTPGATAIAVLKSRNIQDNIINQFDLRRVYGCKLYYDARKLLTNRTDLSEDKASGVISIVVKDRDRNRAHDMAQAYIDKLNELTSSLSTSAAHRERIFLGKELDSIKDELSASTRQLAQFSSRNAMLDMQKQGEATLEAATKLQSALITSESELSALRVMYADDNVRVRGARARIAELQAQLQKSSGDGQAAGGTNLGGNQSLPSLRALPLLGSTYYDMYRQVSVYGTVFETLTKQYELAKVQEAKEIPSIKVLDQPNVPEEQSAPHRLAIAILGSLLSALGGITWIAVRRFWWGIRRTD
jgi:capsule polysaccharide export protein KpsE/RkpR